MNAAKTLRVTVGTHSGDFMLTWPSGRIEFVGGFFRTLRLFFDLAKLKHRDGWTIVWVDLEEGTEEVL